MIPLLPRWNHRVGLGLQRIVRPASRVPVGSRFAARHMATTPVPQKQQSVWPWAAGLAAVGAAVYFWSTRKDDGSLTLEPLPADTKVVFVLGGKRETKEKSIQR